MEGGLINPLALIRTGAAEGVTSPLLNSLHLLNGLPLLDSLHFLNSLHLLNSLPLVNSLPPGNSVPELPGPPRAIA